MSGLWPFMSHIMYVGWRHSTRHTPHGPHTRFQYLLTVPVPARKRHPASGAGAETDEDIYEDLDLFLLRRRHAASRCARNGVAASARRQVWEEGGGGAGRDAAQSRRCSISSLLSRPHVLTYSRLWCACCTACATRCFGSCLHISSTPSQVPALHIGCCPHAR